MVLAEIIKHIVIGEVGAEFRTDLEILTPAVLGPGLDVQAHGNLIKIDAGDAGARAAVILEPLSTTVKPKVVVDLVTGVAANAPPFGVFAIDGRILFPSEVSINCQSELIAYGVGSNQVEHVTIVAGVVGALGANADVQQNGGVLALRPLHLTEEVYGRSEERRVGKE